MAQIIWALLCRRVITDRDSNSVSYIDAIEGLGAPALPLPLPPLVVATLWRREAVSDRIEMRIRFLGPSGNSLHVQGVAPLAFGPDHQRYRVNVGLAGMSISEAGEYGVHVDRKRGGKWEEVARLPLDIQLAAAGHVGVPASA